MKTLILLTGLIIALLAGSAGSSWSQDAEKVFEQGIIKEDGEGSLSEAIDLYRKVADDPSAARLLRAKSLYRMGICYVKLGQEEARNVFTKLVKDFSDQPEIAASAKKKLLELETSNVTAGNDGIIFRKVLSRSVYGTPSPDGRYVTYVNWPKAEVTVHDLKTGKEWVVSKTGTYNEPSEYPDISIWSPDGKQIAYYWFKGKNDEITELHIVNSDGTNDRILTKNSDGNLWAPYPLEWSQDGEMILCQKRVIIKRDPVEDYYQFVLVSVRDGSEQLVKDLVENYREGAATFSSDGKYIIYTAIDYNGQGKGYKPNTDIYYIPVKGGDGQPLITNPENEIWPFRVPGTNQILYFSNRSGKYDLWTFDFAEGKIQGTPKLVRGNLEGFQPLGISKNGTFFFLSDKAYPDIFQASIDFEKGEILSNPAIVFQKNQGKNIHPLWSPSGNYMACFKQNPPIGKYYYGSKIELTIKNLINGELNDISTDLYYNFSTGHPSPVWFRDEKYILMQGWDKDGLCGLFLVDTKTGAHTNLLVSTEKWDTQYPPLAPQISPDGQTLYYFSRNKKCILAHSMVSGTEKVLSQLDKLEYYMILSPDGKFIAYSYWDGDRLNPYAMTIISTSDDSTGNVLNYNEFNSRTSLIGWSADSQNVYFFQIEKNIMDPPSIMRVSINSSVPVEIISPEKMEAFKGMRKMRIHNNGKDVLTVIDTSTGSELWVMENLIQK